MVGQVLDPSRGLGMTQLRMGCWVGRKGCLKSVGEVIGMGEEVRGENGDSDRLDRSDRVDADGRAWGQKRDVPIFGDVGPAVLVLGW